MMQATISADIVSSTSLAQGDLIKLTSEIEKLAALIEKTFCGCWVRLIKGDYIECLVPHPKDALRIALTIKTFTKMFEPEDSKDTKDFSIYGIRQAIGIGKMRIIDKEKNILDGEAIYLSGRAIEKMKNTAKGTFTIECGNDMLSKHLRIIAILTDAIMNNTTQKQCEVLHLKLLGMKQTEIAKQLNISQSTVNKHSTAANWHAINETLKYFESLEF